MAIARSDGQSDRTCSVKYKTPVENREEADVPEQLRWSVSKLVANARSISVHEILPGSQKLVNSVTLTLPQGATRPDESVEEIAQALANIMQAHWESKADTLDPTKEVEPIEFRFQFSCPKGKTKRPSFKWIWDPQSTMEDPFADSIRGIEQIVLRDLLDTQTAALDRYAMQQADTHERFLKLCELNAAPIEHSGSILGYATQMNLQAMQMMVGSLQMNYSHEAQKALEEAKSKRWEAVIEKFGEPVGLVLGQLGMFAASKLSGQPIKVPRGGVGTFTQKKPAAQPTPRPEATGARPVEYVTPEAEANPQAQPEDQEDETEEEEEAEVIEHEIAYLAEAFGDTLSAKQRRTMRQSLSEDYLDVFDALFCADTDDEALDAYAHLKEVPRVLLLPLYASFDPDQRKIFDRFVADAEEALKAREDAADDGAERQENGSDDPDAGADGDNDESQDAEGDSDGDVDPDN